VQQCYNSTCPATSRVTAAFSISVVTPTPCPEAVVAAVAAAAQEAIQQQPGVTNTSTADVNCTATSVGVRHLLEVVGFGGIKL